MTSMATPPPLATRIQSIGMAPASRFDCGLPDRLQESRSETGRGRFRGAEAQQIVDSLGAPEPEGDSGGSEPLVSVGPA